MRMNAVGDDCLAGRLARLAEDLLVQFSRSNRNLGQETPLPVARLSRKEILPGGPGQRLTGGTAQRTAIVIAI